MAPLDDDETAEALAWLDALPEDESDLDVGESEALPVPPTHAD